MNLTAPDHDDVIRSLAMPTEKAIQRVMYWTQDWGDTKRLAFAKAEAYYDLWQGWNHTLADGALEWLEKLKVRSSLVQSCSVFRTAQPE